MKLWKTIFCGDIRSIVFNSGVLKDGGKLLITFGDFDDVLTNLQLCHRNC